MVPGAWDPKYRIPGRRVGPEPTNSRNDCSGLRAYLIRRVINVDECVREGSRPQDLICLGRCKREADFNVRILLVAFI